MNLPDARYKTVVIDPPWPTGGYPDSPPGKGYSQHPIPKKHGYASMTLADIRQLEIAGLLEPDAFVFLWTTSRFIRDAFTVADSWGLQYMCMMVWDKVWGPKPSTYPTYNAEFVLLLRQGRPKFLDTKNFRLVNRWQALIDPTVKNMNQRVASAKPEGFYELLRRVTPAPRLDIFARRRINGFDAWGDQAPGA